MADQAFIFREEWLGLMEDLTVGQQNILIRAVIDYAFTGQETSLPTISRAIFRCIKGSVDRTKANYAIKAEKNRINGRLGGRPKKQIENHDGYLGFMVKTENNPKNHDGFEETQNTDEDMQNQKPNNPKNHDGFFGFMVKTQKNPILIPYSYILNPLTLNLIPYPSSFTAEEEEQQRMIEYFFFVKNFLRPQHESIRIITWSNMPTQTQERTPWSDLTDQQKDACLVQWKSEEQAGGKTVERFPQWFRDSWLKIYATLAETDASPYMIRQALSDSITWEKDKEYLKIRLDKDLAMHIERNLDPFRPYFQEMVLATGTKNIRWVW